MTKRSLVIALFALTLMFLVTACGEKVVEEMYYSPGEAFVTNVYDSDKLLKINITLGTNGDFAADLALKNAVIRDTIIRQLVLLDEAAIEDPAVLQLLSESLVAALNEKFPVGAGELPIFSAVYYSDVVTQ